MNGLGSTYSSKRIFAVIVVVCLTGFISAKQAEEPPQTTEETSSANVLHSKPATDQTDNVPYDITKALMNVTTTSTGSEHPAPEALSKDDSNEYTAFCPSGVQCSKLGGECINCDFNMTCEYGKDVTVSCRAKRSIHCIGEKEFKRTMNCRYCYQTPKWQHSCKGSPNCRVVSAPREQVVANCTVSSEVVCLGNRKFLKKVLCNWTAGYRWTTTLVLSITLGGFGADRFYLGHWQEGIGKLFSFGGLGVWTLIDVILIAIGYLGPADGSLYIW